MEIIFLGSGSALPTKDRMLSSIVISREGETFLFDCGEATQYQMMSAGVKPFKIKNIFITHLHGDHIYGLPGFLSSMSLQKRSDTLNIYGPEGLKNFIITALNTSNMIPRYTVNIIEIPVAFNGGIITETEEYTVSAIPIDHSVFTLGYRFQEKDRAGHLIIEKAESFGLPIGPLVGEIKKGNPVNVDGKIIKPEDVLGEKIKGKSICYATDTGYSLNTIELAKNADILIHEATLSSEMQEEAIEMKHSTTIDAANIAKKSNVKLLIITHISSRNEDVEKLVDECKFIFPNSLAAYDFLRLNI
jgi:ribonuclease Z